MTTVPIYKNDLKYRRHRINTYVPKDINFVYELSEAAQEIVDSEINMDSMDARLTDMLENIDEVAKDDTVDRSKTVILDLSHLKLEIVKFPNETNLLTHIDLSNNNLKVIPSLTGRFAQLQIFDCGSNSLTELPDLPATIIEINCIDNNITNIDILTVMCPRLSRLDCSNNKLTRVPTLNRIDTLICSSNQITEISNLPTVTMIIANENGLEKVTGLPAVKVLNVCYNKLKKIEGFPVLEELYCSNNLIHTISDIPNVEIIDCYKNDLTKILYFPKLKEIIFDFNDRLSIDTRYKIGHVHKSDLRKLMHLTMG